MDNVMTELTDRDILNQAIVYYGVQAQMSQTIQEMAELIQAITKFQSADYLPHEKQVAVRDNLIEEIADVEIMIDQMKIMFGELDVSQLREYKLERLLERMNAEV